MRTVGILAVTLGAMAACYWVFNAWYPVTFSTDFVAGTLVMGVGFVAFVVAAVIANEEESR